MRCVKKLEICVNPRNPLVAYTTKTRGQVPLRVKDTLYKGAGQSKATILSGKIGKK